MFDTLVRIDVGSDSEMRTFEIYKGALCFYSGYFNASLNGRFIEARDGHVKLPTEDPQIFELFRMWIHTRRFYQSTLSPAKLLPLEMIGALWVFGDAHDVPLLQNVMIDIMVEKVKQERTFLSVDDMIYVNNNTTHTSQLRQLVEGIYEALTGEQLPWERFIIDDTVEGHRDSRFTNQHLQTKIDFLRLKDPRRGHWGCKYHVHEQGASCSAG